MCDPTDPYTMTMSLCSNGMTASGWECTGHAHIDGQHIHCSDASHTTVPAFAITVPSGGLTLTELLKSAELVTYPLNGTERWTCSAPDVGGAP